jgi:Ca2+-binding RTX toxin-like protein
VDQLNAATAPGTYAFIDVDANTGQTNAMGTDAIKVAILYKPGVVTPVGQTAPLNTVAFVNGGDPAPRSRPSLAQAFEQISTGEVFIVDVNHLKSKGSACTAPDAGDGQGNCNQVRVNAATELMTWLAGDPTGTGDPDVLLIGDYNSYAMEDPIDVIKAAGYTDLIQTLIGEDAYSYVFDGQSGYLDHALTSSTLTSQVSGVTEWHINADEPVALDYNLEFKSLNHQTTLYNDDQFRVSDHDPVIVGLNLDTSAPSVTINQASGQADPTGLSPINFEVVFSEPVSDFTDADVTLSGTAGATTAVVTGGPTTYDVALSGMTANGTVTASIPAGAATDAGSNGNTASTSTDNTVTYNNTAPTIAVAAGGMCSASGGTLNLTVNNAESSDTLTLSGSSSNLSVVPNGNIVIAGSGANRTVAITAVTAATIRTAVVTITVSDGISTASVTVTVLVGTSSNNTALNGTSGADLILGLGSNDTLNGLAGNDLLCGGAANDTLNGGDNDDTLGGEAGNDVLTGGAGNDRLLGGNNNDSLTGGTGADFFSGGAGNDSNVDFNAGQLDTTDGT